MNVISVSQKKREKDGEGWRRMEKAQIGAMRN